MTNFGEKVNFIWSGADLLRGDYRQADYGKVILPMTMLRRLDCVLEPTKEKVVQTVEKMKGWRRPRPLTSGGKWKITTCSRRDG